MEMAKANNPRLVPNYEGRSQGSPFFDPKDLNLSAPFVALTRACQADNLSFFAEQGEKRVVVTSIG